MPFNPEEFQKSINSELSIIKNRVENLINIRVNHHGEDGNYREAILRNVIKRFLPSNISIGTGFIISNKNNEIKRTTQIDIILYDNTHPLLFKEGDFIIATPKSIKAIIEVKTTILNTNLDEYVQKAKENYDIIIDSNNELFNGIFAYNYNDGDIVDNRNEELSPSIKSALTATKGKVNHISLGKNIFLKYWNNETRTSINSDCQNNNFFNIYNIADLSFSYFISNLIEYVVDKDLGEQTWFMYPKANGKEQSRLKQYCI